MERRSAVPNPALQQPDYDAENPGAIVAGASGPAGPEAAPL